MRGFKRVIYVVLIAAIAIGAYKIYMENSSSSFLMTEGTDEQKIADTLKKFEKSYNDGDFDNLLECCTDRFKSNLKSEMGLTSSLFNRVLSGISSGFLGLDKDMMQYIWSLGTEYCQMDLGIQDIYFFSENEAEVKLLYIENKDSGKEKETEAYVEMEKDGGAWRVASDFYQYSKR